MPKFFPPEGYVSIPQAAKLLQCGEISLYKWIAEGKFEAESFRRYPASEQMAQAIDVEQINAFKARMQAKDNRKHA